MRFSGTSGWIPIVIPLARFVFTAVFHVPWVLWLWWHTVFLKVYSSAK